MSVEQCSNFLFGFTYSCIANVGAGQHVLAAAYTTSVYCPVHSAYYDVATSRLLLLVMMQRPCDAPVNAKDGMTT